MKIFYIEATRTDDEDGRRVVKDLVPFHVVTEDHENFTHGINKAREIILRNHNPEKTGVHICITEERGDEQKTFVHVDKHGFDHRWTKCSVCGSGLCFGHDMPKEDEEFLGIKGLSWDDTQDGTKRCYGCLSKKRLAEIDAYNAVTKRDIEKMLWHILWKIEADSHISDFNKEKGAVVEALGSMVIIDKDGYLVEDSNGKVTRSQDPFIVASIVNQQ